MKKKLIPSTNQFGNGVTQWSEADAAPESSGGNGEKFSWNNLVAHLGDMFNGIGNIVGNANSYSRSTTNTSINDTTGRLVYRNGTTITVIILGGIAILITLILVLGKK